MLFGNVWDVRALFGGFDTKSIQTVVINLVQLVFFVFIKI
jgi:hypothetical protein